MITFLHRLRDLVNTIRSNSRRDDFWKALFFPWTASAHYLPNQDLESLFSLNDFKGTWSYLSVLLLYRLRRIPVCLDSDIHDKSRAESRKSTSAASFSSKSSVFQLIERKNHPLCLLVNLNSIKNTPIP